MAVAQFVVTVEYTPREMLTTVEVEAVLREALGEGIQQNVAPGGPLGFIVDQFEVVPVVGGSLSNPKV